MSLLALRTAIVDTLKADVPAVKDIDGHGGRFGLDELKRWAVKAPAIRVAVLGLRDFSEQPQGKFRGTARIGLFLLTKDTPGSERSAAALAIVDALIQKIPGNTWGMDQTVNTPKAMRGENLYGAELDKSAIALWALAWEQEAELGVLDEASLDVLATFDASYEIGDDPDTPTTKDQTTGLDL